jgi:hypothetical protein
LAITIGTANTLKQFSGTSDYAKGFKKVPFDGTKEYFLLWTTRLFGSVATYNCKQANFGTVAMPKSTDDLEETKDAEKKLLLARKMNDTAMCLFNLLLTGKVSQMALYSSKTHRTS